VEKVLPTLKGVRGEVMLGTWVEGVVLKTASETLMHTKMMSCNDFEWGRRN